jgi:phage gpG-like protein
MKFGIRFPKEPPTKKIVIQEALIEAMQKTLPGAKEISVEKYFRQAGKKGAPPIPEKLTYRTGELARSITYKVKRKGKKIVGLFGTNKVYGRIHELGEGNYPKRQFLEPALKEIIPKFMINAWKAVERQTKANL